MYHKLDLIVFFFKVECWVCKSGFRISEKSEKVLKGIKLYFLKNILNTYRKKEHKQCDQYENVENIEIFFNDYGLPGKISAYAGFPDHILHIFMSHFKKACLE